MSVETSIEWTDTSWNPVRGCSRVSEGCRNCYAERQSARFCDPGGYAHGFVERTKSGPRWTGKVELVEDKLTEPLRWKQPRRVFVNSMSDLFHEGLSDEDIDRVFAVMACSRWNTFQVLTKRPERMRAYLMRRAKSVQHWHDAARGLGYSLKFEGAALAPFPLPNVWLGVSVEDQATADVRIPLLLDTPAAVRFVSAEPLLEAVDLTRLDVLRGPRQRTGREKHQHEPDCHLNALTGHVSGPDDILPMKLDWVIVGGESGPGARPCDVTWVRAALQQCKAAGTACFVKQLGAQPFNIDSDPLRGHCGLFDLKGGDPDEWPEELRVREFPGEAVRA